MTQNIRFNIGFAIAAFGLLLLIQYFVSVANQVAPIPYSQFQQLLHDRKIASVGVSDRFIQGSLKEPLPGGQKQFVTTRVDPEFANDLDKYGVSYTGHMALATIRAGLAAIPYGSVEILLHPAIGPDPRDREYPTPALYQYVCAPQRRDVARMLTEFHLPVSRDRGFDYAEVTAGGVPLSEIDLNTMRSRVHPNLFLCGEILDVDGKIGGYNFQWAWASGRLAGLGASRA